MRQKENNGKSKSKVKTPGSPGSGSADKSLANLTPLGSPESRAADKIGKVAGKTGGKTKAKR